MLKSELHLKEISIKITFTTLMIILSEKVSNSFLRGFSCFWLEKSTITFPNIYSSENVIVKFLKQFQEAIKFTIAKSRELIIFAVP